MYERCDKKEFGTWYDEVYKSLPTIFYNTAYDIGSGLSYGNTKEPGEDLKIRETNCSDVDKRIPFLMLFLAILTATLAIFLALAVSRRRLWFQNKASKPSKKCVLARVSILMLCMLAFGGMWLAYGTNTWDIYRHSWDSYRSSGSIFPASLINSSENSASCYLKELTSNLHSISYTGFYPSYDYWNEQRRNFLSTFDHAAEGYEGNYSFLEFNLYASKHLKGEMSTALSNGAGIPNELDKLLGHAKDDAQRNEINRAKHLVTNTYIKMRKVASDLNIFLRSLETSTAKQTERTKYVQDTIKKLRANFLETVNDAQKNAQETLNSYLVDKLKYAEQLNNLDIGLRNLTTWPQRIAGDNVLNGFISALFIGLGILCALTLILYVFWAMFPAEPKTRFCYVARRRCGKTLLLGMFVSIGILIALMGIGLFWYCYAYHLTHGCKQTQNILVNERQDPIENDRLWHFSNYQTPSLIAPKENPFTTEEMHFPFANISFDFKDIQESVNDLKKLGFKSSDIWLSKMIDTSSDVLAVEDKIREFSQKTDLVIESSKKIFNELRSKNEKVSGIVETISDDYQTKVKDQVQSLNSAWTSAMNGINEWNFKITDKLNTDFPSQIIERNCKSFGGTLHGAWIITVLTTIFMLPTLIIMSSTAREYFYDLDEETLATSTFSPKEAFAAVKYKILSQINRGDTGSTAERLVQEHDDITA